MGRGFRALSLAFLAALEPSCGKGSGDSGGPGPNGSAPTAVVTTPVGAQHSNVPVDFTLGDAESNPISITVEVSLDGGTSWGPATPGYGNGSLSGLTSSPGGTPHTFLWNSVDDGAGIGGLTNVTVRLRITPSDGNPGTAGTSANFTVDNTVQRVIGVASALFPHTLPDMGTKEMALGDLVAQAMKARYGTQLAFQNGWGIRCPLPSSFAPTDTSLRRTTAGYAVGPPYDLVIGDLKILLPFGNRVVTRTVTGAQLWAALENGFVASPANFNGFPQIAGFTVAFKQSNPAGSRVLSVALEGGGLILNNSTTYTFATNDFMNAGGDGYTMLDDGQGTSQELLDQVVADYIQNAGTVSPTIAGRITIVP